ncbi:MAG TPA: hypothetical protein VM487_15200 [Phycisphaerae bacterium]|nr:hypothetical protein [Phycisphaerae bacterium]
MPSEEEILKYTLDVSDVEAKAGRLNELLEQIKAKRAAGGDASELEAQVGKELDGLGKLADKEKEAAGATEDLLGQKQKLTAVVRLLGGEFSRVVGNLGGVVALLTSMGPAAAGATAALVGISVVTAGYQKFNEELQKAIDKQTELNQKVLEGKEAAIERGGGLAETLLGMGGISRFDDAALMMDRLRKQYGFGEGVAQQAAAVGTMAGLTVEQTGMLAVAQMQGARFPTAQAAQESFGGLQPEAAAGLRDQLGAFKATAAAQRQQRRAQLFDMPTAARFSDIEALFTDLKDAGRLPEGVSSADDLRRMIDEGGVLRGRIQRMEGEEASPEYRATPRVRETMALRVARARFAKMHEVWRLYEDYTGGQSAPVDIGEAPGAGGDSPAVPQFITIHNERVGTMYKLPNPLTRNAHWGLGVEVNAGNSVRSKNGY